MKDLLIIIWIERKTLLRGLAVSFLLILPFTFLPAIIKTGLSIESIAGRLNESLVYSLGFAIIVVIASLIQNYTGLVDRKWYFDRPAFKSLDFYGRIDGLGSIVESLETFLLGQIGGYYFRLHLVETEKQKPILEIVPLITLTGKDGAVEKLKLEYGFERNHFFGKRIYLNQIDLENSGSVKEMLTHYSTTLKELDFQPLEVDERELAK